MIQHAICRPPGCIFTRVGDRFVPVTLCLQRASRDIFWKTRGALRLRYFDHPPEGSQQSIWPCQDQHRTTPGQELINSSFRPRDNASPTLHPSESSADSLRLVLSSRNDTREPTRRPRLLWRTRPHHADQDHHFHRWPPRMFICSTLAKHDMRCATRYTKMKAHTTPLSAPARRLV
ncbi:uncharacterized protein MYCFIDRAFT_210038 [Pseudocercospora fijiensis CIRAD86]|uniref:Uncharacterized protein n=1 Tax=Pseudocercospora fijiensis (strain CIRAD86) TaxID=383855 RepID=N1Q8R4_PSEFD|nr:uncharacterized protein MYCFIDRAFT_210038 [Pseudocercospora fijiensis CIRAD86]EME89269.1 hypothetical protein MYCFIDRAFT_181489 [Pseudocercospora fijiensis CIRAD86]